MAFFELFLRLAVAYAVGSLMGALIVGKLRDVDVRRYGSKNPGTTNAFRVLGSRWGSLVLFIDIMKGMLAVTLVARLPLGVNMPGLLLPGWLPVFCGLAAIAGHGKPLFFGFRGGKGVATAAGVLLGLAPIALLILAPLFTAVLIGTGYVSLSSLIAAAALPFTVLLTQQPPHLMPRLLLAIVIALFVLYAHRDNLSRLRHGTEHRFYGVTWRVLWPKMKHRLFGKGRPES